MYASITATSPGGRSLIVIGVRRVFKLSHSTDERVTVGPPIVGAAGGGPLRYEAHDFPTSLVSAGAGSGRRFWIASSTSAVACRFSAPSRSASRRLCL